MLLQAATRPREEKSKACLILADRKTLALREIPLGRLPDLLKPHDLLVLNDAATMPASLFGKTGEGAKVELRLLSESEEGRWRAVAFGPGDWRQRTEDRVPPPILHPGDSLQFSPSLRGRVKEISPLSSRLLKIEFDPSGADLWREFYAQGRPVQYSYLEENLSLWHVQSAFSARPWAVEMPSAGAALPMGILFRLREKGVRVASLTHACGLSASGDAVLDASFPLGERYEIPEKTVRRVSETLEGGGRVIAAGTSVMRALEGNVLKYGGFLRAGEGRTELLIAPGYTPKVVGGLLTGLHEMGESHFRLAASLFPEEGLNRILKKAEEAGMTHHEFGDLCLIA
ncbi:MAG: S-adenosylmethionine:tRNA ribosyltransferase-isomerase [bacterium]